jgi:transcriptional regulator with XRE-family HTH domain
MLSERVGLRIWELRNQKGLTQKELLLKARLDRSYLSSIENGKYNLNIANIDKIAVALDISLAEFFEVFIKDVCPDIIEGDADGIELGEEVIFD